MNDVQKEWYRQRVAAIHEQVTAYDVVRRNGLSLTQAGEDREEQFSCPFHGEDKKPSARIYPARDTSPSHVWCFVCQETGWDAIGLWKKFNNLTFGQAVSRLEREYNLETPEIPEGVWDAAPKVDTEGERFERVYLACEGRLLASKSAYRTQGDMRGYLNAGSILDRVKFRVGNDLWTPERGVHVLQALLDRIHMKTTACLDG
jgi:hypothetical protein